MALKHTITALGGISVPNAYVRIREIVLYKNQEMGKFFITIEIAVFKDSLKAAEINSRAISAPAFDREQCLFDLTNSNNVLVQAYNYLKSLPKYSGAIDV